MNVISIPGLNASLLTLCLCVFVDMCAESGRTVMNAGSVCCAGEAEERCM